MLSLKTQKKRALLVGLNYMLDPKSRLNGCCNDVRSMAKFLTTTAGFSPLQVETVVDDDARNMPRLTYEGLVDMLYGLAIASWREDLDVAIFHYSGHGSQTRDLNGDERDGMDEGIVPLDYRVNGLLLDDTLYNIFMKFNPKTHIFAFFDSCHSGTVLDLPFAYDMRDQKQGENGEKITSVFTSAPKICCMSGCRDTEFSMDVQDPATMQAGGAMTSHLLELLKEKGTQGYPIIQLQNDLNEALQKNNFTQKPLLTSSKPLTATDLLF